VKEFHLVDKEYKVMIIDIQKYVGNKELYYVGELCAKITHSMQANGRVHLYTKEARNGRINGLFSLLDQLCLYWKWDKTKITIESSSIITEYSNYNVIYTDFCHPCVALDTTSQIYSWNKEKYYGLFIGHATSARIRAIHNHKNFKYSNYGLTSFNEDLFNYMSYPDLVEYFFHSNQTYTEMLEVKPYSDIRELVETPNTSIITPPYNCTNWGKVYEKIAIEIVCETSTEEDCFGPSEKILRPCYYKRPFLVIGSPNFLKNYQKLGYKTFDGIINESYDQYSGFARVDAVFNILEKLINRNRINTLLDECADILEHNHQWVKKEQQRQIKLLHDYQSKTNCN
jgi:hypothetical protein